MPVTPPTTFAELLDVYEREILPSKAPWTQYSTQRLYRRFRETLGPIPLAELTPAVLRDWRDTLSARYRPSTVRRYLYAVSDHCRYIGVALHCPVRATRINEGSLQVPLAGSSSPTWMPLTEYASMAA